jgi:hypothetical protein
VSSLISLVLLPVCIFPMLGEDVAFGLDLTRALGENFAGPWSLRTMLTRYRAMHLFGGVIARPLSFEFSSSARLSANRQVPPWVVV